MFERTSPDPTGPIDGRTLRLIGPGSGPADYFCPCCDCTKSGWEDWPNLMAEWCRELACACHGRSAQAGPQG